MNDDGELLPGLAASVALSRSIGVTWAELNECWFEVCRLVRAEGIGEPLHTTPADALSDAQCLAPMTWAARWRPDLDLSTTRARRAAREAHRRARKRGHGVVIPVPLGAKGRWSQQGEST